MEQRTPLIMLVDDDLDFLEMNRHVLEARGYRVVCFSEPEKAFEQMAEEKPDIVITDLMMSTLDSGFSFSRRMKDDARFRDVPVVIVTAVGSRRGFDFVPRSAEELKEMRVDAYFDKPVTPETLLAKVEELLQRDAEEDPP
jgi:CheY-like chemotaxis protein